MVRGQEHFDELGRLLDLERQAERERFAEDRERLSLTERERRGLVFLDLETLETSTGLGGRTLVWMERRGQRLAVPLRVGDVVEVRPRKAEIETPPTALVSRGGRGRVQLAFDRPPPPFFDEGRLRLDLVPSDITYQRARNALARVAGMDAGIARTRRETVLGNLPARSDRPESLKPPFLSPLNPEQQRAVEGALAAKDFFLVHGPPGTGKSTVLAEVAARAVARGQRLLCTAASNAAVDHLLELCLDAGLKALRVGHPARVLERLQEHTLDERIESHPDYVLSRELFDEAYELQGYARRQRTQGRSRERFQNARASKAEASKLFDDARALERKALRSILESAQVVCVTLSSLDSYTLSGENFDLVLLDEATQATEPLSLMAFTRAPTMVLAGDPQQLPPTVISPAAQKGGLGRSLFERLKAEHPDVQVMLREQYRMHRDIMTFPSTHMYAGELRAHESVAERALGPLLRADAGIDAPPLLFLDTAGKGHDESTTESDPSRWNDGEAALVVARVKELMAAGLRPEDIGVLSPYAAQVSRLRETLSAHEALEVDSIDAFQGREKAAILLSLVRSNTEGQLGFLEDLRRINVAMTRAQRHLFIVGDSATLGADAFYGQLIEYAQGLGSYRSAWEWPDPEVPTES